MDNMLEENKNLNLKDTNSPSHLLRGGMGRGAETSPMVFVSYTKTNKLISALYMVTDIMDTGEPMRNKLRTLGVNIISDINLPLLPGEGRGEVLRRLINEIFSLLDIAQAVGMISEMNHGILKKEFSLLKESIQEESIQENSNWLEGFLNSPLEEYPDLKSGGGGYPPRPLSTKSTPQEGNKISIGRVGVQSGSTLLKALKDIEGMKAIENIKMSNRNISINNTVQSAGGFEQMKKQRRELILKIIKDRPSGASIKDIVLALRSLGEEWGEKTLQRELVSMSHDGVLEKTREKRWSRYSIVKSS